MKPSLLSARLVLSFLTLISPVFAQAMFEVGASGTYRRSNIDQNSYDESKSMTASISYYLTEASAIEFSYTDGSNKRSITNSDPDAPIRSQTSSLTYRTVGLDFIFTLGTKEAILRPYIKAGAQYIFEKRYVDQTFTSTGPNEGNVTEDPAAIVPSFGAGMTLRLSERLSFKFGMDAWSSRSFSIKPVTFDYAGRAGISWFL